MNLAFDIFPAATPLGTRLIRLTAEQLMVGSGLRVELAGNGSGVIVMNRNQPEVTAANFANDNYVQVFDLDIDPTAVRPLGGFFLDTSQVQVLSLDEEGGQTIRFGGTGAIVYLDRARLANVTYTGEPSDGGPHVDGLFHWYGPGPSSPVEQYGDILRRLLREAQAAGRPLQPLDDLTYDFTSTDDSAGDPWDGFTGEYTLPIGINYLDVVQRFRDLGLTILMDGDLGLHAYQNFYGTNRTSATFAAGKVRLEAGINIDGELARELKPSLPLAQVLVRGDSSLPTDMLIRTAGSYDVVREGFVEYPHSHVVSVLNAVGDQALNARSDAADQPFPKHLVGLDSTTGLYSPFPSDPSYVDATYWLGDLIRVHTGTEMGDYNEANLRVYAINWSLDENGNW